MDFGIKKILKQKQVRNKKIVMAELFGNNLFAILIFDDDGNLVDSECNTSFSNLKNARKITNYDYRKKLRCLQSSDNFY